MNTIKVRDLTKAIATIFICSSLLIGLATVGLQYTALAQTEDEDTGNGPSTGTDPDNR